MPKNSRRPLRTFLTFAMVVGLASIALAQQTAPRQEVDQQFRRWTTNLQYNQDGSVGLIRFSKPLVDDEKLSQLDQFPELTYLAIVCPQVTDAGIKPIGSLEKLQTLIISDTPITSDGLATIAGLEHLEVLSLARTKIDDRACETIAKLKRLRVLSLEDTRISDHAMEALSHLENLEALFVDETLVTDASFKQLARLPNLALLSAEDCPIRRKGLSDLSGSASLEHLALSGCDLDAAALPLLADIPAIKTIEVYGTGITQASVDKIWPTDHQARIFFDGSRTQPPIDPAIFDLDAHEANPRTPVIPPIAQRLNDSAKPDFQRHVIPLLGRLGCNGRSCHGSFQGKGGFQLSMFGYDFKTDLENLRERIDLNQPGESLLVLKPTSEDEHEGGKRFEFDSWQQNLLKRWIASGAGGVPADSARFVRLEIAPAEIVSRQSGESIALKSIAVWSDGSREDVTALTRFETTDDAVASVSADGVVTTRARGDAHVIAYYDNGVVSTPVILPIQQFSEDDYPEIPTPTRIDELTAANWKKLGIIPSQVSEDAEFLRRVSLDLIGTLPTADQVRKFLIDEDPSKRRKKIDELLEHPAYVAWWTTRLCDLTGSNAGYLGNTEMAQPVAAQWRAWIERRVRDNVGWDKMVEGILTSTSRQDGQSYRAFVAQQSTFTRKKNPADYGAFGNPMPHFWFRDNIKVPSDKTLAFGYTFMGLRLDCAQCHKHPFDRWSQQDFDLFTQFFTRIKTGLPPDALPIHDRYREWLGVPKKLNTAALRRQSYLRIAAEGRPIPWREVYVEPAGKKPHPAKLLGSLEVDLNEYADPRVLLMQWLRTEPDRYLAKAMVNRIWANYFGVGIIESTDDLNLANPPSNRALLDYLTDQFVRHQYDLKWLHRTIASSRTYQLTWRPNESNLHDEKHFSHAILRRLPAEVAIDALLQVTANDQAHQRAAEDVGKRKINQHPKSYQTRSIDYSLLVFGKPLRTMNCDCERQNSPTLPQALFLRNDEELHAALDRPDGWIAQLSRAKEGELDAKSLVVEAYLRTLTRPPRSSELRNSLEYLAQSESLVEAMRDLLWVLINTQEFIANH